VVFKGFGVFLIHTAYNRKTYKLNRFYPCMEKSPEKKNLTLRIEKDILQKAKELGLNISHITESTLKAISLPDNLEVVTSRMLRVNYRKIFGKIVEILKEREVKYFLKIGEHISTEEFKRPDGKTDIHELTHSYFLSPEGKVEHFVDEIDQTVKIWDLEKDDWPTEYIYPPEKILTNLVEAIYNVSKRNSTKLKEALVLEKMLDQYLNKLKDKNEKEKK